MRRNNSLAMAMRFSWPDKSKHSKGAFDIVRKLRKVGHKAYIAGGAVRDALLKRKVEDIDIATSAAPAKVKKLFLKTIPTGEKHGTITVRLGKMNYEVTSFRTESAYESRRRPKAVSFVASPEKDAKRRDFTLNALFYDPEASHILDFVGGLADLRRGLIRTVGSPDARLREDALRLMRAARFATVLNLSIERETRSAVKKNAKLIRKISAERIKAELDKIISSDRAPAGIGLLDELGLLQFILPELKDCQRVTQQKDKHAEGDVYTHSILSLENSESQDLATRYATLFHDLGKVKTRAVKNGKITFYKHPQEGSEIVKRVCGRLRFSKNDAEKIIWLVKSHMVPDEFINMRPGTRRRWGLSPYFGDLLAVHKADAIASLGPNGAASHDTRPYEQGLKILKEIKSRPELGRPIISGNDVMKILKIKSGPSVGKILRHIEEKKLAGKFSSKKQALDYLQKNKKYFVKY